MEFSLDSLEISNEDDNDASADVTSDGESDQDYCDIAVLRQENTKSSKPTKELSSFENWLLKKSIEDERKRQEEKEQQLQLKRKQREEEIKQEERRVKAIGCHKQWVAEKSIEDKKKKEELIHKKKLTEYEAEAKKINRERKSKESFRNWYQMKTKQKKEQEKKDAEKLQAEIKEREHRRCLAERAYSDWLCQQRRQSSNINWWYNVKSTPSTIKKSWVGPLDDYD